MDFDYSEGSIQSIKNVVPKKISKIIDGDQDNLNEETLNEGVNAQKIREKSYLHNNGFIEREQSIHQSQTFNYP